MGKDISSCTNSYCGSPKGYIWSSDYVSKYESLWNIFQKFAAFNYCKLYEIKRIFGLESSYIVNRNWKKGYLYFDTVEPFDENRLINILQIDSKILKYSINQAYVIDQNYYLNGEFNKERDEYLTTSLRYCPICIKNGFHTALFQYNYLDKCPIHEEKLISSCPECGVGVALLYKLQNDAFNSPFACHSCGYNLYPNIYRKQPFAKLNEEEVAIFDDFVKWRNNIISNKMYIFRSHGLSVNPLARVDLITPWQNNIINQAPGFWYQCKSVSRNKFTKDIFANNQNTLVSCYEYGVHTKFIRTKYKIYKPFVPSYDKYFKNIETEEFHKHINDVQVIKSYYAIFKSIRRHIFMRYIKKHRKIYDEIRVNGSVFCRIDLKEYYKIIYAFIAWEKHWLGETVFLFRLNKNINDDWINSIGHALLFYPVIKNIVVSRKSEGNQLLLWISNHLISSIFLQSFLELYYTKATLNEDIHGKFLMKINRKIIGVCYPIFLFVKQTRGNHHKLFMKEHPVLSMLHDKISVS